MNNKFSFLLIIGVFISMSFFSCKGKLKSSTDLVQIREMSDPQQLNPINSTDASASTINGLIFAAVNGSESNGDFNLLPMLTKELGKVSEINEGEFKGGMRIDYEIREDAKWDNGTTITAEDYIFTIKTILNPKTNCEHLKSYYDWVGDIIIDSTNKKKFSVLSNIKYFKIEEFAGYYVIPEYNYDKEKTMRKFSIKDMNTKEKREALKSNNDILKFAKEFNSEKFQRDPEHITGFGPYKLTKWITGQEIVLERKKDWWGDKYKDLEQFKAFPKKIKFKVINDQNSAITALKNTDIDAFDMVPAKEFNDLQKDDNFTKKFKLEKLNNFAYLFLYMNLRNDKFKDRNLREALARAVDRKKINETISFGDNILTESFVHPTQKTYNKDLKPYEFDLKKSNELLDLAGWKDTDGDGIRDKVINGKKTQLTIEFKYNAGNEQRKNTALIIQEDFKKIGIQMEIVAKEWTVFLQDLDKLQFEMTYAGFTVPARISDPKQTWHTSNSGPGGDNKSGWGNIVSNKLIDDLNQELDFEKRKEFYLQLQKMIHDDIPVIYLFSPINRLATNKKFEVKTKFSNPGYSVELFRAIK